LLLESLQPLAGLQAARTRCHVYYHLGQVLMVQHDFVIIDFEGEPARSIAERRAKHSPLRDVAGMLRSLSYAAGTAVKRSTGERPADRERLAPLAADWEQSAAQAFLAGYRASIDGCASWPRDDDAARRLIDLFLVEKALYEIRYEKDNRPDWLDIPVCGLLHQLTRTRAES
jgi:maltose alpha-D-glucosyltransferase/alpha-amylase